ncbi:MULTISPECIES: cupin domain-containing protein [Streptomyces]|uniref:Cupin domain-containing protein n=2 Tax=Streptomyces cyaneofuscatus TaxID=66883 RepID=A0ABZ1EQW5_9ACTN|nr:MULTISPECIES: cupin domain-containing protein [Streptomyces]MYW30281.1 cupin domain-containing protein [Streptomyces sp. SID2119]MZF56359.1 cupin domain-containing protein [Streptomyces sp. SID5594]NDZ68772.1 cupin domain-containing protein [Streptomyces cyaneofuscatus]ONI48895.1 Quercetin 2,3-dioxygenase [Streptomyces sp. IB2014 011-1]RDV50307.1 cupin domain-containing protein [Streptomyces sp. IB2014 011-12]
MTMLPRILLPGEGEAVQIGTTTKTTFKAVGHETDDRLGLFEHRMEPGAPGASPHIHREQLEAFYVLDGVVELHLDGETFAAPPGTYVNVPENMSHGFRNPYQDQATMLIIFTPAINREEYFRGLAELYADGNRPTEDELLDLMARYDQFELTLDGTTSRPGWGRH